jgi:hypothetical protein
MALEGSPLAPKGKPRYNHLKRTYGKGEKRHLSNVHVAFFTPLGGEEATIKNLSSTREKKGGMNWGVNTKGIL